MQRDYLPINKELIPYTFSILLGEEMFDIRVDYNSLADMFTLSLYKNEELICAGEPVIYGVQLWKDVFVAGKYPNVKITPIDESGETDAVTWDNLNETVFLVVDEE